MIISRVRQRRVAERIQVSEQEVKNFLASDLGKMQLSEELHLANILVPTPESANSEAIQNAYRQAMDRSEEHTSELQSLMRISYAVFCLKKKTKQDNHISTLQQQ